MKKYVKLNAPLFLGGCDQLRCESIYRKSEGYCIEIAPVKPQDGTISMAFCIEAATRCNTKKQAKADAYLEAHMGYFVDEYLMRICRPYLHRVEE